MRCTAALFALALAMPAAADTPEAEPEDGFSLLEEGAKIIMRSMLDDIGPKLDEMRAGRGDGRA